MKKTLQDYIRIPEGKFNSDTFLCNKCGMRMLLKIRGDSTACRSDSCNGTMYRQ